MLAAEQAPHAAGRVAHLGPHRSCEVCVVGEPEIGGEAGEILVAVGQPVERGAHPQAVPEPGEL